MADQVLEDPSMAGLLAAILLPAACGETKDPPSPSMASSSPTAYTDRGPDELIDRLPVDRATKIVVHCRSDRMSRVAVEERARAGCTKLHNLNGGFTAWEAAGYSLLCLGRE